MPRVSPLMMRLILMLLAAVLAVMALPWGLAAAAPSAAPGPLILGGCSLHG